MNYLKNAKLLLIGIVWIIVTQVSFANGGPGVIADVVVGGHAYFEKVEDVLLEKEDLTFDINKENMHVKVVYTLVNQGQERDINYIFPVTRYIQADRVTIRDFTILADSETLSYSAQDEEFDMAEEDHQYVIDTYGYDTRDFGSKMITTNFITTLHFEEGEKKEIVISYSVSGQYDSYGTSKMLLERYSDTRYYYDLTPASNWGNGKVGEFNLKIDYQDILEFKSMNANIPDFHRDDTGIYTYSKKQYNFANQKKIIITYYHPYELKQLASYHISSDCLDEIYVSSTLPDEGRFTYSVSQMFDNNLDTAWVEGSKGFGIGDSIELLFEERRHRVIGIINGYTQSKETYYNNTRLKKIKVEALDIESNEELQKDKSVIEEIYEFEDIPYEQLSKDLYYKNVQFIGDLDIGIACRRYVRITILEVYKGKKYEDTAISEMLFFEPTYTWDPFTIKEGYKQSSQPIKEKDRSENIAAEIETEQEDTEHTAQDVESSSTDEQGVSLQDENEPDKTVEIVREKEIDKIIESSQVMKQEERDVEVYRVSLSQESKNKNIVQSELHKKQQVITWLTIICSGLIIAIIGFLIYLVRNRRS